MNNEVEVQEETGMVPATKAPLTVSTQIHGGLVPRDLDQLWRMSTWIAKSGMAPKGMQTPEAVAVAIQMGLEVGLSPMQSVQNIAVINGRPAIWGDAALALVRASGELEEFSEWKEGEKGQDSWTAYCKAKRKGDGEATTESFSWLDAKRAKLVPAHGDSPWSKYPQRMLQMRARSWALRDKFTDVLKGLQIREEQADVLDLKPLKNGTYSADTPKSLKERLKEQDAPSPAPEPPMPEPPEEDEEVPYEDPMPVKTPAPEPEPQKTEEEFIKGLRKPGMMKYLLEHQHEIPGMNPKKLALLEDKCRNLFKHSLAQSLNAIRSELTGKDPATGAVNGTGDLIDCPNDPGSRIYESECANCMDRQDCPAWD